ncbi:multidrug effflux MFS transporter [Planktotalea sp.]|uniref:multidrug effflux MFS transporter n=1 Tax=Planktotalea sp. TaxID=2029877 RepID=UPI002600DC4C|nr:multidrug effflux MFS transporter [Planktotalea sp.]
MNQSNPTRTPPTRTTLILLTAISVLTLNLFLPSLPSMAADFGVSYGAISYAISGFLVLSALLSLILGPLSDKFGRRPVLLVTFAIFALASVGAAVTEDFTTFLAFRMLQAASATGSILSRAIVRDMYPPGKGTSILGYIAMAMAIAPMIGPLIGGLLEETLGWRSIFWLYAIMGCISVALIWLDLGETAPGKGIRFKEQVIGYGIVLRSQMFWSHSLVVGFSVTAFFVFLAGVPLVASTQFGLAPAQVGMAIGTIAGGFFVGSFFTGRFSGRLSLGKMMIWGRMVAIIGPICALALLAFDLAHPVVFFGLMATMGIGNGLSIPAANTGAMSVRPDLAGSASGLTTSMSTAMGAAGSAITGAVLTPENGAWVFCVLLMMTCIGALFFASVAAKALARAEKDT